MSDVDAIRSALQADPAFALTDDTSPRQPASLLLESRVYARQISVLERRLVKIRGAIARRQPLPDPDTPSAALPVWSPALKRQYVRERKEVELGIRALQAQLKAIKDRARRAAGDLPALALGAADAATAEAMADLPPALSTRSGRKRAKADADAAAQAATTTTDAPVPP